MNSVLLNNVDHRELRVITERAAEYGDAVMSALTFPDEFRNVQAHYPIVFQKASDGRFQPVALFGLRPDQNLFLTSKGWEASYVPLSVERQPFLIGVGSGDPMIHIDLDSPRVSRSRGEPLFREHGGTSEFLDRMSSVLRALHEGVSRTPAFVAMLLEHDLLEPFTLEFPAGDGSKARLVGFYVIHEERLGQLPGTALERLQRTGYLQPIYMMLASLSNFRALIDRQSR